MPRRRSFSKEFKLEAVRRVLEEDRGVSEVARELGISPGVLSHWKTDYLVEFEPAKLPNESPDDELSRLRRELERVRQERDFLKKAVAYFSQHPQ